MIGGFIVGMVFGGTLGVAFMCLLVVGGKSDGGDEFVCPECGLVMRDCARYDLKDGNDYIAHKYVPEFCPECGAKTDKEGTEC